VRTCSIIPCFPIKRSSDYRLMSTAAFAAVETWSRIRHPNIVSVREAFTTRAFNDSCTCIHWSSFKYSSSSSALVMVYDYHPNAETLFDLHFNAGSMAFKNGRAQQLNNALILERTLWSYIIQIANAIQVVHDAGMAVRVIDATKILITGKNRSARRSLVQYLLIQNCLQS
jgi:PAB-dependent poly(A)-specific ribonuclease subunit 3